MCVWMDSFCLLSGRRSDEAASQLLERAAGVGLHLQASPTRQGGQRATGHRAGGECNDHQASSSHMHAHKHRSWKSVTLILMVNAYHWVPLMRPELKQTEESSYVETHAFVCCGLGGAGVHSVPGRSHSHKPGAERTGASWETTDPTGGPQRNCLLQVPHPLQPRWVGDSIACTGDHHGELDIPITNNSLLIKGWKYGWKC